MQASPSCSLCVTPAEGDFFGNLFAADFVPRAQCVGDRAGIIWLHVLSDAGIALAYFSIPIALASFVRRRKDLAFPWMFWLFAGFILACGTTHVLNIVAFWRPMYRLDGMVKAATAGVSALTAVFLWPLVPRAVALASPSQLKRLNDELNGQIEERRQMESRLEASRDELEERVRERTAELAEVNRVLAARIAESEVVEECLRESKVRLQQKLAEIESLYKSAPVGLCYVDRELVLGRVNQTLADAAGVSLLHGVGKPITEAMPVFGPVLESECRRVVDTGQGTNERSVHVQPADEEGRERQWLMRSSPVLAEDESVLGVNILLQDVTDRTMMEERIRQSQKTEAVGQLAAGIAHEINNALTAIYGYLSLARAQLPDGHNATSNLDRVLSAAEQAGHITKALLTFSRNDATSRKPVELRAVVDQAMALFGGLAPANIKVRLDTAAAAGLMVNGDATQLQQIVMNLAINARDAMPKGGVLRVELTAARREGDAGGSAPRVRLTISDTGVGMTRQIRERVFEPFFTTKPRGQGTGLGTSVVHGIVRSHGGEIWVESAAGEGTTFTIELPTCAAPAAAAEVMAKMAGGRATGTILLAEDNGTVRELLASGLRSAGYTVVEVRDGQELMDKLSAMSAVGSPISALVLDVDMPHRSGIECLRQIRGHGNISLPVVLVTGGPVTEAEGIVNTYILPKPFHVRELVTAVMDAMRASSVAGYGDALPERA